MVAVDLELREIDAQHFFRHLCLSCLFFFKKIKVNLFFIYKKTTKKTCETKSEEKEKESTARSKHCKPQRVNELLSKSAAVRWT